MSLPQGGHRGRDNRERRNVRPKPMRMNIPVPPTPLFLKSSITVSLLALIKILTAYTISTSLWGAQELTVARVKTTGNWRAPCNGAMSVCQRQKEHHWLTLPKTDVNAATGKSFCAPGQRLRETQMWKLP